MNAGEKAAKAPGHARASDADQLARYLKFQMRDGGQNTWAVAIFVVRDEKAKEAKGPSFRQVVFAKQGYKGGSVEFNKGLLQYLDKWMTEHCSGDSYGLEIADGTGECMHAEMAIVRHLNSKKGVYVGDRSLEGFSFGASLGCCPLCMCYLTEFGAAFGEAGNTPLTGWSFPNGKQLAHP